MEPFDTIDHVRQLSRHTRADVERLRAVADVHPDSAELWDVLGDVMRLCTDGRYTIEESIACYNHAVKADPGYATAYESLGYAYDTYFDDFDRAAEYFRLAVSKGGGDTARIGLARVFAQLGDSALANAELDACTDQDQPDVRELRREIAAGIWCSTPSEEAQ